MANRYPLIVNTTSGNSVQELPSGDFLDLSSSGISNSGNIIVSGIESATGNVTGSYFIVNVSSLTGIASGTPTKIVNGTSEANIGTSGGNANISIGGTSNVFVVASTGIYTTGLSSITGNITAGNISATNHTGATVSVTGSITAGGDLSLVGNIVDTGALSFITSSNGNISLLPNGSGNINTGANIMPTANATANIGSATSSFNTIFAKATSAQYADLAEMYCADSEYTPGTVLEFGGTEEVTITTQSHSTQVAGIVSTNPSYLMNSTLTCTNAVEVALVGRVPCHVVGTIAKGDRLVASLTPGIATRLDMSQYQPGCIIGKALEAYDSETVGTIEVAVGRI